MARPARLAPLVLRARQAHKAPLATTAQQAQSVLNYNSARLVHKQRPALRVLPETMARLVRSDPPALRVRRVLRDLRAPLALISALASHAPAM